MGTRGQQIRHGSAAHSQGDVGTRTHPLLHATQSRGANRRGDPLSPARSGGELLTGEIRAALAQSNGPSETEHYASLLWRTATGSCHCIGDKLAAPSSAL